MIPEAEIIHVSFLYLKVYNLALLGVLGYLVHGNI